MTYESTVPGGSAARAEHAGRGPDGLPFYRVDFSCDDRDPLQARLNAIFEYADDVETKVLHRSRLNLFFLLLDRLSREGALSRRDSALDIGCNGGAYSRMLSDFGFAHVRGVDIEPRFIETARREFAFEAPERSLRFDVGNAEEIDTREKVDFVLCTEVIEHTSRPDRVVQVIREILKPGGVAVVTLPNRISLPFQMAWWAYRLKRMPKNPEFEDHLNYPFYRSLKLFDFPDLELLQTDGTNLLLPSRLLRALYRTPIFGPVHHADFLLSRLWPLKFFTQFFYLVLRKRRSSG
ncbi:MAG: methyltransferase domain-containing protein [Candidatus Eiseniibacteriota bacterium]